MKFIISAFLLISVLLNAQETESYSLQKCIDIGLKNNADLINTTIQSESALYQYQQSVAAFLPFVNAYANQGISTGKSINPYTNTFINQEVTTGQYGVNASMNLFNGLYNYYSVRQMYYNNKAGKADIEQLKIDLSIQITLAYLQVLASQELLKQAEAQMEITKAQAERLAVLESNNAVSPSILYDTRGQLANDKLYLIDMRSSLVASKLSLSQLINVSFSDNATFEPVETNEGIKEIGNQGFYKDLPGLQSASLRKNAALKNRSATYGLLFPTVTLNGSIGTNYSSAALNQKLINSYDAGTDSYVMVGTTSYQVFQPQYEYSSEKITFNEQLSNNLNTYVGIGVQLPLLNGLRNRTIIKQSKLGMQQAIVKEKTLNVKYKAIEDQLRNDISASAEKLVILKQQESDYNESFRIASAKFENGAITTYDYITAKTNFEKAKAAHITARYEYALRIKTLAFYQATK